MTAFIIEHQCPQCGAPATLEETDRLFKCGYCRVSSYLTMPDYLRYTIDHQAPSGAQVIYYPYWRFKGMLFSCLSNSIDKRFLDVSIQALKSGNFPITLGFRGQTQKLRFAAAQNGATFVKPQQPFSQALSGWTRQFGTRIKAPILHQDYIGETYCMIYSPYYFEQYVMDGVLNQPISNFPANQIEEGLLQPDTPKWPIHFLATLCPQCGWDLTGDRDSLALNCVNCQSVWWARKGRLEQLKTAHFPQSGHQWVYLPFWRIQADIRPVTLCSYADFIKLANLPKVIQAGWERKPFYFWNPAFKVRPQSYLTIANNVTMNQPVQKSQSGQPNGTLQAVTLPLREAIESLQMIVANFMKPIERRKELVPRLDIKPRRVLLVYIPFKDSPHELIQPELSLAINKNMLVHAKNL